MQRLFLAVFVFFISVSNVQAQNPLPDFTVEDLGNNKVRVSWVNPFGDDCIQLTVQSSIDSLRNFKTIFSTESPQLPQNGFVYQMPFNAKWYFHISYVLAGNAFYFTASKTPGTATASGVANRIPIQDVDPNRIITVRTTDSIIAEVPYSDYMRFRDSIAINTKDTLFILTDFEVLLKPFDPFNNFVPSVYVVTNKSGFIQLKLPDANSKKYKVIFYDLNGKKLFGINHVTDSDLVIDKTNFMHAGWFKFELYEDDKLKERNKILLQRDF